MDLISMHTASHFVDLCVLGNTVLKLQTSRIASILILTNILATSSSEVPLNQNSVQLISLYASIITPLCQFLVFFFPKQKVLQQNWVDKLTTISAINGFHSRSQPWIITLSLELFVWLVAFSSALLN